MTDTSKAPEIDMKLFWACFIALVTTSFGFILRALTLPQWGEEFNLTNTQIGEIAGVGLWPFAISIVLFSLIVDRIGYKNTMIFGFVCHVLSAVLTYFASGYWSLYIATFLVAIGNGTVEAVVNPVVATMFPRQKTKWLNILHAGWPGGLVLGGIMALLLGDEASWKFKMILILLPTMAYGVMMFFREFPINERVKAGVSYMEMLKEVGGLGALIVNTLIVFQIGTIFNWPFYLSIIIILVITGLYTYYVRSMGQPIFILLILLMVPLAITELGTDSWISELMAPEMRNIGIQAGWILVYTSAIMMVLRLFSGVIVHRILPLNLLAVSSAVACFGLLLFSVSTGIMVLVAATLFAFGKTFFWPTMLAIVSERFPKGGALTLNITGGVGMMAAGVLGAVILGFVQDESINRKLMQVDPNLHAVYATEQKESIFGVYQSIDQGKLALASDDDLTQLNQIQETAKKEALLVVAIFPIIMLMTYLSLMLYFKSKGGYKVIILEDRVAVN
ncbi:MAG: MFS transporter [Cyclobacteriaceae bacterium]|nr:MFS transporter [Cyclobacteriaceae bacterium]